MRNATTTGRRAQIWVPLCALVSAALLAVPIGGTADELSLEDLKSSGEQVYANNCAACHQAGGEGVPGIFPELDGNDKVAGDKTELLDIIVNGVPGTAMAAFGPQLDDEQIAAVTTYIRNSWGNELGDTVQPADVEELR